MASGSFAVSTSNGYIKGTVSWSSTENIANNTSTVTATMILERTNTGYTTYGSGSFTLNIGGNSDTESKSFTLTYNSNTTMVSHSATITHNSDGKKSITISWSGSSDVFTVTSGSGTAVLDTIPRASTLGSSASWTAGSNLGVTISRADSSFVHSVYVYVNGVLIDNKGNIGTSTTFSFTEAENTEIFNQLNTAATQDTKILVITYAYSGGSEIGRNEYTGTVTAPNASIVSSGTDKYVWVDQAISIGITRYHSSFYHTLQIYSGTTLIKTISNVTTSTSFTFTQAEQDAIYATTPNSNDVDGKIIVTTYYNGEKIRGSTETDYDFTVRNSNPTFSASGVTYKDNNTTNPSALGGTVGITGNNQYIIQYKSDIYVIIPAAYKATPVNQATMVKYEVTYNGVTKTANYSTGDITVVFGMTTASSNTSLSIKAIDSRGNSTTQTKTVSIIPYSSPSINSKATRLNNFENDTTVTMSGSISALSVAGVQKNAVTAGSVEYRYKDAATTTWGAWTDFTFTTSGTTFTATNKLIPLDNLKSWNIEVRVSDKLETKTFALLVGTGQPIFFLDDILKAVGVGKFPEIANGLDVKGEIRTELQTTVLNPLNPAATAHLGWLNNVARIRYGGTGEGNTNGFEIQGTGDAVKWKVLDNGEMQAFGPIRPLSGFIPEAIPANSNLDNYTAVGFYYCSANATAATITNRPTGSAFSLLVEKHAGIRQVLTEYVTAGAKTFVRNSYGGTWGAWRIEGGEPNFVQPSLAAGWTRYSTWALPGYYKDAQGFVYLQGMVTGGTMGSTIFTLGADYVPRASHGHHIFLTANSAGDGIPSRIYVYTDGRVVWMAGGNSTWISLSGISFFAGQI